MTYKTEQQKHGVALIQEGFFDGDEGGALFMGKPRSFVLQDGLRNLYPSIRDDALAYFELNDVKWWHGNYPTGHVLSSQIACLNHLFPIRNNKTAVLKLLSSFSPDFVDVLPITEHLEGYIQFEAVGGDVNFLNEGVNTRGSNCTSLDALIYALHRDGRRFLIPIEWKYVETYGNKDKSTGVSGPTRKSRYLELIAKSKFLNKNTLTCCWYEPFYQLMRQTLWVEQLLSKKVSGLEADDYLHIHVVPDENVELLQKNYPCSGKGLEKTWKSCLIDQGKYIVVSPSKLWHKQDANTGIYQYLEHRYWPKSAIQEIPSVSVPTALVKSNQHLIQNDATKAAANIPVVKLPDKSMQPIINTQNTTQKFADIAKPLPGIINQIQRENTLLAFTQQVSEAMSPVTLAATRFQERISKAMEPLIGALNSLKLTIPQSLIDGMQLLSKATRPFSAIDKLAKSQYVYWDYLEEGFVDSLIASTNLNKTLREYHEYNKFKEAEATIEKCLKMSTDKPTKKLFKQALFAYDNKQYDIAVIGFVSLIDGLLTTLSGNFGTNIFKRANIILARIENEDVISSGEYSIVALTWTFRETMESLCTPSPFGGKEPKSLNRHWIAHGRSKRRKTRLDCIKLINFIYGASIISSYGEPKEE